MEGPRRFIEKFSQDMLDRMSKDTLEGLAAFDLYKINQTFAEINKLDDDLAAEVEDVRRQYEQKGYVEYEDTDDDEKEGGSPPAPAPVYYPAPGRRRRRPGVVARKSGGTKRLN
jgi:hypothetical protein